MRGSRQQGEGFTTGIQDARDDRVDSSVERIVAAHRPLDVIQPPLMLGQDKKWYHLCRTIIVDESNERMSEHPPPIAE